MRLLIVEDDMNWIEAMRPSVEAIVGSDGLSIAQSKASALSLIGSSTFDLIVLDLKIPTADGKLDADPAHGRALYEQVRENVPGTPVVFLTGFASDDFYEDMLNRAGASDVWGSGKKVPLLRVYRKTKLPELVQIIEGAAKEIDNIESIEINCIPNGLPLSDAERRLLKVFGRKQNAGGVLVSELAGGLGGSRVLKVDLSHKDGHRSPFVAAKIGASQEASKEYQAYYSCVVRLRNGTYSVLIDHIETGAGQAAGVFYRLLEGYDTSLFEVLRNAPEVAAGIAKSLQVYEEPWVAEVPATDTTIGELRRTMVPDASLYSHSDLMDTVNGWREFESRKIRARWCCQHRDLHGGNVLVSAQHQPTLIDFGAVGSAPASLDPITLELSLLFHPKGREICNGWPGLSEAAQWADGPKYWESSPFPEFIHAVRQWSEAVAIGRREVLATAYAYCARQIRYQDTDAALALAVMQSAISAYSQT